MKFVLHVLPQRGPTDSELGHVFLKLQAKQNMGNLRAMKTTLEKAQSAMLDMATTLEAKAAKDDTLKSKVTEVTTAAEAVKALVQDLRSLVCSIEEGGCEGEQATALNSRVRSQLEAGDAHLLGWRAMSKRLRAILM